MLNRRPRTRSLPNSQNQPYVFDSNGNVKQFVPSLLSALYSDFSVENCSKLGIPLREMSNPISRPFDAIDNSLAMAASVINENITVKSE